MDTKFTIYNYSTDDGLTGSLIVRTELCKLFDENTLFDMKNVSKKTVTLNELLTKGYMSVGSTDTMEPLDLEYNNDILKVKGLCIHGSRKELIGNKLGLETVYEPENSDIEEIIDTMDTDFEEIKRNYKDVKGLSVEGLSVEGLSVEGLSVEGLSVEELSVNYLDLDIDNYDYMKNEIFNIFT
jgi:hypothetical protein